MGRMYTLDDLDLGRLDGVVTLIRVDFNVPLAGGEVLDATRLEKALPTLRELQARGARVLLASHCGRPKGQFEARTSLRPVARALEELIGGPVGFAEDCIGEAAQACARALPPGGLCLLENLRFHAGEKANDPAFAEELAALAEVYVGDAFATAHRAHASVVGLPERLERRAAGRLLVREVEALGRLLEAPERPFAALVGGAKIEGKVDTLRNLLPRLDLLLLGGGMANTFLAACGCAMADSLVELERLELAREILAGAREQGIEVVLPTDLVVTDDLEDPRRVETVPAEEVPPGTKAVDLGEESRRRIAEALAPARTVFWNGPMGVFEVPPFDRGTLAAAEAVAGADGFTVIGGGETVAAAGQAGILDRLGHVSTGGGASLELLAGKCLPGVAALQKP